MNHLSEDQIIMVYYHESSPESRHHLESCPACQEELENLRQVLDSARDVEVPEPGSDYGRSVWLKIESQLNPRPESPRVVKASFWRLPAPRRFSWLAALLVISVGSYFVGRQQAVSPPLSVPEASLEVDNEAILRVALADHLDRCHRLMREISNTTVLTSDSGFSDRADRLLAANRLYRLVAQKGSDPSLVMVLDDLERWFIDVAHMGPETASLNDVQQRLQRQGLILKLSVMQNNIRRRSKRNMLVGPNSPQGDNHGISV